MLEKYTYDSGPAKGNANAFVLAWEKKGVHGKEVGKGIRAAFRPHTQKSLALSYDEKTDVQLFSHEGTTLAAVNSSGI